MPAPAARDNDVEDLFEGFVPRSIRTRRSRESAEEGRVVHAGGLDIFVRERGEGHPLLMVNGLGGNLEMWGRAEDQLSSGSRLIMFDAPGMGRSQTPLLPLSIPAMAKLLPEMLDALGYETVDVLGYSMGGVIAQQLAKQAPHRIRRLALVGTACGWGSMPGSLSALSVLAMPLRYYSRSLYETTSRLLGDADGKITPALEHQADARMLYPPSLLGYSYMVYAGATWSSLRWLPSVDVPTLVVSGTADRLVPPANAVQLAGLLPNSRLHLMPDEGHLLLFNKTGQSYPLLSDYFAAKDHRRTDAWRTGTQVDDTDMVRDAFRETTGGQPFRLLSGCFRWLASSNGHAA